MLSSICMFVELQAGTPAPSIIQNDVGEENDSEPSLNENDDEEDDVDDVDQGEELNTQHLVLAQFDKVVFGTPPLPPSILPSWLHFWILMFMVLVYFIPIQA